MSDGKPVYYMPEVSAEFDRPEDALLVSMLIKEKKMTFAQAVDYAELRRGYHWRFVCKL